MEEQLVKDKMNGFCLKGNFIYMNDAGQLQTVVGGYGVCVDGISQGVFKQLPAAYKGFPIEDRGEELILPGLVDLHAHAPQYGYRGIGKELELLDWLETYTFPIEKKFGDLDYARQSYQLFVDDLLASATTRIVLFATIHVPATLFLMQLLETSGMVSFVGKVNMDRNSPDYYRETSARASLEATRNFLDEVASSGFSSTYPILTPRFIPSCSDELMYGLGKIQEDYDVPVQSHLSENRKEIAWVRQLCPDARFYGDCYYRDGLFGGGAPTIMAHCVSSSEDEIELMAKQGVFVAHCPSSNECIASGIAPIRRYLDRGMNVGFGSDVAGGYTLSIFNEMAEALKLSKMYWRYLDEKCSPLSVREVFDMATRRGGRFFGKVGSFDPGYQFDAVSIDDSAIRSLVSHTLENRLERLIYLHETCKLTQKYIKGKLVFSSNRHNGR
jgi:guanine deaminase